MRVLVTGGCGFIGSNLIKLLYNRPDVELIVNVDCLTYAGDITNVPLEIRNSERYAFERMDITSRLWIGAVFRKYRPDVVFHLAAESHVDNSINNPGVFVTTNVLGTQVMLACAQKEGVKKFVHVSTDEVYGDLNDTDPAFTELSPIKPSSPYSASKAGSDLLALASFKTFGLPVCVTRCSNNYGPNQHTEKLIPRMISLAAKDQPLPVYGTGKNVRDWIYVEDHCRALLRVAEAGEPGQVYNIGSNCERTNLEIVSLILKTMGKPESLINFVTDRPGHDWRYAINSQKIRGELGWEPETPFDIGIIKTIDHYANLSK